MHKQGKKWLILALVALVVVAGVFGYIYWRNAKQPVAGNKHVAFTVVHADGSEKAYPIDTSAQFLGEALMANKLIEGEQGEYGLFVKTVDGESADDAKQQWWCLTKGGQDHMNGVDTTVIEDGDAYEFTLKTGW
ncbi:MAG: DUF4430 domain-containing protein [Clostridia bacterium]